MRYGALVWCVVLGVVLVSGQSFAKQTGAGRDPTRPAMLGVSGMDTTDEAKKNEDTYLLSSIIISPTRRLALINAMFVKVGDRIGDARVVNINKNSVVLSAPGKKITIYLLDQRGWE